MSTYVNPSTHHNGSKQILVQGRGFQGPEDVPFDNVQYVRKNGFWEPLDLSEALEEAPSDGTQYVRKDGVWVAGDFSVAPAELFPKPIVFNAITGSEEVTSASWTAVGFSKNLSVTRAVMMLVTLKGLPLGGASTWLRARLSWTGATSGDSYTLFGSNWRGCISGVSNTVRDDASLVFPLLVNVGTTTFQIQAMRQSGTATCTLADAGFTLTPVGWADHYEA